MGLENGFVIAAGARITDPETSLAYWLSASARLRVEVPIEGGLSLALEGAGLLRRAREHFERAARREGTQG